MKDVASKAWWLLERSAEAGHVVIIVSASFSGRRATRVCPPKQRRTCTLSVVARSVGYRGRVEKGKLVNIVRKCNEYIG